MVLLNSKTHLDVELEKEAEDRVYLNDKFNKPLTDMNPLIFSKKKHNRINIKRRPSEILSLEEESTMYDIMRKEFEKHQ